MADLLGLSVLTVRHFLWREQIFMAIILVKSNPDALKSTSVVNCSPVRLYEDKKSYTHLPEYRFLRETHFRYSELINKISKKMRVVWGSVSCIEHLQHHAELLLQVHSG